MGMEPPTVSSLWATPPQPAQCKTATAPMPSRVSLRFGEATVKTAAPSAPSSPAERAAMLARKLAPYARQLRGVG